MGYSLFVMGDGVSKRGAWHRDMQLGVLVHGCSVCMLALCWAVTMRSCLEVLVLAGTYFKEFASMEGLNIVLFVVGVLITLLGVYILTFSRRKVEEDKLPTEGTTVHLDGDGCGDDTKTTPNALGPITVNDLPGNGGNVPKEPSPIRKVPSGSQI